VLNDNRITVQMPIWPPSRTQKYDNIITKAYTHLQVSRIAVLHVWLLYHLSRTLRFQLFLRISFQFIIFGHERYNNSVSVLINVSRCHITSANPQTIVKFGQEAAVDDVWHCLDAAYFIACRNPFLSTCYSGPVLSRTGSIMITNIKDLGVIWRQPINSLKERH